MNEEATSTMGRSAKRKKKIDYAKLPIRTARSRRYNVLSLVILTSVGLPTHQYTKSRPFSVLRKYVKHPSVYSLFCWITGYRNKNKREDIILLRDGKYGILLQRGGHKFQVFDNKMLIKKKHLDKRLMNYEGLGYYLTGYVNGSLVQN